MYFYCNSVINIGTSSYVDASWPSDVAWVHLVPWGFRKLLKYVYEHFNHPEIFVTENGWADLDGTLNDTNRITYIGVSDLISLNN